MFLCGRELYWGKLRCCGIAETDEVFARIDLSIHECQAGGRIEGNSKTCPEVCLRVVSRNATTITVSARRDDTGPPESLLRRPSCTILWLHQSLAGVPGPKSTENQEPPVPKARPWQHLLCTCGCSPECGANWFLRPALDRPKLTSPKQEAQLWSSWVDCRPYASNTQVSNPPATMNGLP